MSARPRSLPEPPRSRRLVIDHALEARAEYREDLREALGFPSESTLTWEELLTTVRQNWRRLANVKRAVIG